MKAQNAIIEAARTTDAPAIAALLRNAGLPSEDFKPHLPYFLVARFEGDLVGAIGAEVYSPHALLRSLVVAADQRGVGLGDELMRQLDARAGTWDVEQWWLLTTTAENFFRKCGFTAVPRASAPPRIQQTIQFDGGCGRLAVCLTRVRTATS